MSKATIKLEVPQTPGDAALILVDQMRTAILAGQVMASAKEFNAGMNAWLDSAERVLEQPTPPSRDRMRETLKTIIDMDRRTSGTTSEDHMEYDGPIGAVARAALPENTQR